MGELVEKGHPCCVHCEDAKSDHIGHGGSVEKDGHEIPCSTCEFDQRIVPLLASARAQALQEAAAALGPGPKMLILVERESCDWRTEKSVSTWLRERAADAALPPGPTGGDA